MVFLFDPEGNSVAAYRSENVDRRLIDYLQQQPVKRPNHKDSYQSVTVPMQALAISDNYLHYLWPNILTSRHDLCLIKESFSAIP